MPSNSISDTIWYISNDNKSNQRLIVDIPNETPNVWQVSKIERVNVRGRTRVTLYQTEFNEHTDYIEKDDNGKIIGMWADYFATSVTPDETPDPTDTTIPEISCTLASDENTIRLGGSYQKITLSYFENGVEIDDYSSLSPVWSCYIDGEDATNSSDIVWSSNITANTTKVKVKQNYALIGKILTVKCTIGEIVGEIEFEMLLV